MVFTGFPHLRMTTEYWLQHDIRKTVVWGIDHKPLVPHETLQSLQETQPVKGACGAVGVGPRLSGGDRAACPLPPNGSGPENEVDAVHNATAWEPAAGVSNGP